MSAYAQVTRSTYLCAVRSPVLHKLSEVVTGGGGDALSRTEAIENIQAVCILVSHVFRLINQRGIRRTAAHVFVV